MNTQQPDPNHPGPDRAGDTAHQAQQPGGGSKYNTAAYQPMSEYDTVIERPKQLGMLRNLTIISLVLYVISAVVGAIIAMDETIIEESLRQSGVLTEAQIDEAMQGAGLAGLVTTIIMTVVVVVLYIVVLIGVSVAKNWARILGIVLAIIGGLFTVVGLVMSLGDFTIAPTLISISAVLTAIWLAVSIWWLVTAFSAPVRKYFKTPPQARG